MKTAKDYVTIDLDYDRPKFKFPDLSSQDGNPIQYFNLALECLKKNGFRKEAMELDAFKYPKYDEGFNLLARFLDFTSDTSDTPYKEDDDFVYFRVAKDKVGSKQLDVFKLKTLDTLKELLEDGHDFSIVNCYGRNHLYYINDLESVKFLVEQNKIHNWFDLFSLDNFNSTQLHGNRSLETYTYLLNEMADINPDVTKLLMFGTNSLGKNSFGEVLSKLSDYFVDNIQDGVSTSSKEWALIKSFVKIIGRLDSEKRDELINLMDNLDKAPFFIKEKLGTKMLSDILEDELSRDNVNSRDNVKKIKI